MSERKPIGSRLRFEIFKRDRFTCRYCGRTTPSVVLEIDHIVPVAEGGTDGPENLVTSCYECNRGKGAVPLDEIPLADEDMHERTVLLLERELQLREYNEVLRRAREREERETDELMDYWCGLWGLKRDTAPLYAIPDPVQIEQFLRIVAAEDIRRAMRTAAVAMKTAHQGLKYMFGILHRWRREGTRD